MIELFLPFLAGSLAFLSPCVVPMLTVYFSLMTGLTVEELLSDYDSFAIRQNIFKSTLFFVAGYTVIFTLVGLAAGFLGGLLTPQFVYYFNIVGGAIIVLLGLGMMGLFKLPFFKILNIRKRTNRSGRPLTPLGAFGVGIIYAVACSHCIGSILTAMLIYAGSKGTSGGGLAMALFSLGLAIPYLVAALGLSAAVDYLKKVKKHMRLIQIISGLFLVVFGILIVTGNFSSMSSFFGNLLPYKFPGM